MVYNKRSQKWFNDKHYRDFVCHNVVSREVVSNRKVIQYKIVNVLVNALASQTF